MSLMIRAYLMDKYGPRITMEQLAKILSVNPATVYNQLSRGEFPIRTYKEGSRRFASADAVAEYLDAMDEAAKSKSE